MTQVDNSITIVSTPVEEQSEQEKKSQSLVTKTPVIHHTIKRRILLVGLAFSTACSTFTGPALGPAIGAISLDLHDYENMSWYLTAFLLSSAVIQLLSIRISDCLGRRRVYLFGITFMSISSLIAGLAINNYMFIIMRVCQGICGGFLMTLSIAVLIDLFPMEKRLEYLANNSIAYGITSTAGPILGGILSDKLSWRYIFGFNVIMTVPVCIILYLFIEIPTKPEQRISKANSKTFFSRVDIGGCIIVSAAIIGFLLGMNFGSTSLKYDWSSPIVIGLLAGSFSLGVILIIYERFVSLVPLFPSIIITNINMMLMYTQQLINGLYYITITTGATVTFQAIYNDTPTTSSVKLVAPTVAFIAFTIIQARITKKLKTPKPVIIAGNLIVMLSLLLITFVQTENSSIGVQVGLLVLYGAGFGCVNQATLVGSQLILEEEAPHMVAASTSLIRFLLQLGCTISISIFFSIMNAEVKVNLESLHQNEPYLYQRVIESGSYRDYIKISSVEDKQVQAILNLIYFKSISKTQYVLLPLSGVAMLCNLLVRIPKMPEKKSKEVSSIHS